MIRRPPRSTRTDNSFPTRRSSDLLAITGLIMLAMRKDAAARAADHMADRESNLGKFIDANTGKIIEQNKALLANERIKARDRARSEEHTSELQSLMRISYAVFCLKKKTYHQNHNPNETGQSRHNITK